MKITNPASGETVSFTFRDALRVDLPDGGQETYVRDGRGLVVAVHSQIIFEEQVQRPTAVVDQRDVGPGIRA